MNTLIEFISKSFGNKRTLIFYREGNLVNEISSGNVSLTSLEFKFLFLYSLKNNQGEKPEKKKIINILSNINFSENFFSCAFELSSKEYLLLIDFGNSKLGEKSKEKLLLACDILKETIKLKDKTEASIPQNFYLPIFIYDKEKDNFIFETQGFNLLLGFPANQWSKNKISVLRKIDIEDFPKIKHFFSQIKNCQEAYVDFQIKDNFSNRRFLRLISAPDDKSCKKLFGLILDITTEMKLKYRIESSNAKFRTLLEISNDFVFSLNRSGYLMLINDDGAKQLGYKTENLIGKHFLELIAKNDKPSVTLAFQKIIKSNSAITFNAKIINALSEEIPFTFTATSLRSGNEITGVIGYGKNFKQIYDCNEKIKEQNNKLLESERLLKLERERAEKQIIELRELNNAKNQFISTVSHELRTPLTSIIGFAETLVEDTSLSRETIIEYNKIILEEGKRLTLLIDDILDLTKLEEGNVSLNFEEFDLADLLKIIIGNFVAQAKSKGIDLEISIPEAEFTVFADMKKLEKAFSNIVSNAIKFTKHGGKVSVKINNFLNEYAVIIKDTGIGIPKEHLKELFQKFQKFNKPGLHIPGAGLGLAITKKIIDLHNGSINITSEEDVGTTVTVVLPKKRG